MTLVFRITLDDDLAHLVFSQLRPDAKPQHGADRVSNNVVRSDLSRELREVCGKQLVHWVRHVPKGRP